MGRFIARRIDYDKGLTAQPCPLFPTDPLIRSRPMRIFFGRLFGVLVFLFLAGSITSPLPIPVACADEPFIPRRQSQPPGPPLTPQQALAKMVVPDGFKVELVASEPDLVNPVAMAFDDRGRIYVTESFEYPRREPGPGRDRIKILEDTNGDGRVDSVKIFAEGLNIPSGIAVGHGGVWVANAPDLLFLEDTDGDDKADKQTVVVTGFGRDDTHELPNALTWGPDGYLYGLNGVFNRSVVKQNGRTFDFTCAMFRIDPATHRFELFCEGTSNPWGIAFDHEGEAFISACVIDHLWHLTESGYYHRQGGPYPPHTWKIDSIVKHKHQMAAYCGIEFFDSPAYPAKYRDKLYMGNIHGGCINVDSVQRKGSTYQGAGHPDFLTANDVWFMPVAQKVGPDGCLYILDWYDRYHCYQDANADPKGVDRGHGRLYRVVYEKRPEIEFADLSKLDYSQLIDLLVHPNIFYRQRASVILAQRLQARDDQANQVAAAMVSRLLSSPKPESIQLLATTLSLGQVDTERICRLAEHFNDQPGALAWCVRSIGERLRRGESAESVQSCQRLLTTAASSDDPRVRLQAAIAAGKLSPEHHAMLSPTKVLIDVLSGSEDDGLLPRIVWQNLQRRVVADQAMIVQRLAEASAEDALLVAMAPRIATRLLADVKSDLSAPSDAATLNSVLAIADSLSARNGRAEGEVLRSVLAKLRTGEIRAAAAKAALNNWLGKTKSTGDYRVQIAAFAGDASATGQVAAMLIDRRRSADQRRDALETIAITNPASMQAAVSQWITDLDDKARVDDGWRDALLNAVLRFGDSETQRMILAQLTRLPIGVRTMVAGRMIQRDATAKLLLAEINSGALAKDMLGPDQIKQLASSAAADIQASVKEIWGSVRMKDSANRQAVVRDMTEYLLKDAHGDAAKGWVVYDRICGQCHKMHGRGYEVGPEITRNGRGSFEQLVVSVFDPSLVIGEAYKSVSVLTSDGRLISGLVTERSEQRIVLKVQGGKLEVIPMDEADEIRDNDQSLMPEGLETQMTRQEMADLFALLSLEQSPETAGSQVIAGTPDGLHAKP